MTESCHDEQETKEVLLPSDKADATTATITTAASDELSRSAVGCGGLSPPRHELLCIVMLAVGVFCLLCGYDTQSSLTEPVLQSLARTRSDIDPHAGYYGQGCIYAFYVLTNFVSPWLIHRVGSKCVLALAAVCFVIYFASFLALNSYLFYVTSAVCGAGMAFYASGQGLYLSEHSTIRTLSRNAGIVGAISSSGPLVGGTVLYIIFNFDEEGTIDNAENHYRTFSTFEINTIWGLIAGVGAVGCVIFLCLPTRQFDSLEKDNAGRMRPTFVEQIKNVFATMAQRDVVVLVPFFVWCGVFLSFWLVAVPTTFAFTHATSHQPKLLAYYEISAGVGSLLGGIYITICSRFYRQFGFLPALISLSVLCAVSYSLVLVSVPDQSTITNNADPALLIMPSIYTCLALGSLNGFIECLANTMRSVVCTLVVPERKHLVYSVGKIYQAAASCAVFFAGPLLTIYRWLGILLLAHVLGAIGYVYVSKTAVFEDATQEETEEKLENAPPTTSVSE